MVSTLQGQAASQQLLKQWQQVLWSHLTTHWVIQPPARGAKCYSTHTEAANTLVEGVRCHTNSDMSQRHGEREWDDTAKAEATRFNPYTRASVDKGEGRLLYFIRSRLHHHCLG